MIYPLSCSLYVHIMLRRTHGPSRSRHRPRLPASCDAARQSPRADLLRRRRPGGLSRPPCRADQETRRGGLGVLSDAQSRPPDCRPLPRARARTRRRGGSPALHQRHKRPGSVERPPVSEPLRLGRDGRDPPDRRGALRSDESGPGAPGRPSAGLALVERPRPLAGTDDGLVATRPSLERMGDSPASWPLARIPRPPARSAPLKTTGRPLGNEAFIEGLERLLGRKLAAADRDRRRSRRWAQSSRIYGDRSPRVSGPRVSEIYSET